VKLAVIGFLLTLLAEAQTLAVKLPPFTREALPNGTVLCLMPRNDLPLVSLRVMVRGGAESDPPGLEGLSAVAADLLGRGAANHTAEQFAAEVDFLGTGIHTYVDPQSTTIAVDVLPANASAAIELLAHALLRPVFAEEELRAQIHRSIELARSRKDSPADVVWQYFRSFFFPAPHPYGRPGQGDELTLPRIGRDAVVAQYARMYVGKNLTVTAVGPFAAPEMRDRLAKAFRDLPAGTRYAWSKEPAARPFQTGRVLLVDKPDATETQFIIGLPGISRTHPDRVPLWLVNNVLGGRFTSLLNERLRIDSGLTYGAYSYSQEDRLRGAITLHSYTATADTKRAVDLALEVLHRFAKDGVSAGQLATARRYIKATYPLEHLQTAGQLADVIDELELYGLGRDEIDGLFARLDAVTVRQANRTLKKYFAVKDPVIVLIGEAERLRREVGGHAYHSWEASIADPGFPPQIHGGRISRSKR
jgi:zinc protease